MPDIQPPGTDRQLADAIDSNGAHATRYEESPEYRDKAPETAESPVREDNKPGLAADSRYGPSLWAEELDTPKQRLSCDEMSDRPCGRLGGTVFRYRIIILADWKLSLNNRLKMSTKSMYITAVTSDEKSGFYC